MIGTPELMLVVLPILLILIFLIILGKYPGLRKAIGLILLVIGILVSLTGLGAIIGIPMIMIGAILYFVGQKDEPAQVISSQQKITVRCPNCKALNEETASFCSSCGNKI